MNVKKLIGIGQSDFKALIDKNCYYIDKTLLLKDIINSGSQVLLFPRPRRFGKTLNLSMMKYFFEKTETNHSYLFEDLKIWEVEEYRQKQGQYPVIYLTFKDIKHDSWDKCFYDMSGEIAEIYRQHKYLLETLDKEQKKYFEKILSLEAQSVDLQKSIKNLSNYLEKYHNQKVIILIDEYDTPIQAGWINNYYDDIIGFTKGLLGSALKDNTSLEKGIITGILRIAKESIFSDLNNLKVLTILDEEYGEYFGLLEVEVMEALRCFNKEYELDEIKDWYNGYIFGKSVIYNPWSILNCIDSKSDELKPYWINTSSNDLIKELVARGGEDIKLELEELIRAGSIEKTINENIVFREIEQNEDALWGFLMFSGYLTAQKVKGQIYALSVPNKEVMFFFKETIMNWLKNNIHTRKLDIMLKALTTGDINTFEKVFKEFITNSFSYFDPSGKEPEKVYHAFVLGLLVSLADTHQVKSNRESGLGRYDIMIMPRDKSKLGIVIEFKKVEEDENEDLEIAAENALKQIEEKEYAEELSDYGVSGIVKLGISFQGKRFMIKAGE